MRRFLADHTITSNYQHRSYEKKSTGLLDHCPCIARCPLWIIKIGRLRICADGTVGSLASWPLYSFRACEGYIATGARQPAVLDINRAYFLSAGGVGLCDEEIKIATKLQTILMYADNHIAYRKSTN